MTMSEELAYYCDEMRHLVCTPYSVLNLHKMAADLGIHRCWYHASAKYPHYDIPKRRIKEIQARCKVVSPREILAIMRGTVLCPIVSPSETES